jgi:hypothetical protein
LALRRARAAFCEARVRRLPVRPQEVAGAQARKAVDDEHTRTVYMDVFKLAFETTLVGLLAFLWLGVATYLLFPRHLADFISWMVPASAKDEYQTLMGVGALTLAYCLGSTILPISNQLVNDEHSPLPENAIRCKVFITQQEQLETIGYTALPKQLSIKDLKPSRCAYWAPVLESNAPIPTRIWRFLLLWAGVAVNKDDVDANKKAAILTRFQQQESTILDRGADMTERLRLLLERIVVLRGAVFSGFILFLIGLFAYFARATDEQVHLTKTIS